MLTSIALQSGATVAVGAVDATLGKTVVNMVSLGFLGFAAAMSLIGAILIFNSRHATAAQLKTGKMWFALAFANVVIGSGIHLWDTREGGSVIVNFSPRFAEDQLPSPYIVVGVA